jgi:cyanate permease|tara:strand:- start:156 stop:308 length:153 start_codon:yes stop_codon:yes gene_type:complete
MNNKTLAIILVVFGGLILFSEQEGSWWVSAIFVGVGSGLFFKKNTNDIDK